MRGIGFLALAFCCGLLVGCAAGDPARPTPKPETPAEIAERCDTSDAPEIRVPALNVTFRSRLALEYDPDVIMNGLMEKSMALVIQVFRVEKATSAAELQDSLQDLESRGFETRLLPSDTGSFAFASGTEERKGRTYHSLFVLAGDERTRVMVVGVAPTETPDAVLGELACTVRSASWRRPADPFELVDFTLAPGPRLHPLPAGGHAVMMGDPENREAVVIGVQLDGAGPTDAGSAKTVFRAVASPDFEIASLVARPLSEIPDAHGFFLEWTGRRKSRPAPLEGRAMVISGRAERRLYVLIAFSAESDFSSYEAEMRDVLFSFAWKP